MAHLDCDLNPAKITKEQIEKLLKAMQNAKVQRPPLDCLSPIGEEELKESLRRIYKDAEFIEAITRKPEVYRGFPFIIEAAIVYDPKNFTEFELIRFANRVPLLYQAGACAITEAMKEIDWKRYGIEASQGVPQAPFKLIVHVCSAWVPFISESKNAIASYPEIIREIKLGIQNVARKFSVYLSGKRREYQQKKRVEMFYRYAPEVIESLSKLTNKNKEEIKEKVEALISSKILKESEEKDDAT